MFKNTKIAVYCRVSSDEQAERGTIDNQVTFAQQYADLHHLAIYDVYKDDGVTGTIPLQDRPEETLLQRLDKARIMRCLSWPALAKNIGVDIADLYKYKQGKKVWPRLIEQIVKWLDNSNN